MGKPRAFLDVPRRDPGYRPRDERTQDFREVEQRLDDAALREQASRCMDCGIPFCHGCGCPLGNVIPEWNEMVFQGRWQEAANLLYATNNFPEFTGRICPAPCEAACTAGLHEQAVAIRQVELAVIEKAYAEGYIQPRPPARRTGKTVAVIGSGPAGLAAADQLNRMGHQVTVYEQDARPGGLLRYGIPDFKLEKTVVDRRIALMAAEGVTFENGVAAGRDIAPTFLRRRFDALCLAIGARQPRDLKVPGRDLAGIHFAMDFLAQQNRRIAGYLGDDAAISAAGLRVVVIGGGDTGSDCVGTAIRQGAASVTQLEIMPEPPEARHESTPWPQWPYQKRTSSSHQEGCERRWSVVTKKFIGRKGRVNRLAGVAVAWATDADGRPVRMSETPASDFSLPADLVLLAMGFTGPAKDGLAEALGLALDARGCLAVDANGMTSAPGIFAAGDAVSGASLVVRAIAAGRSLAVNIDAWLGKGTEQ
jgi:glutamate synthase (NADPH/NADH) small chain